MHPARTITPPGLVSERHCSAPVKPVAVLRRRTKLLGGLLLISGLAMLSACGQKGPLYLPDPNDPTKKRT